MEIWEYDFMENLLRNRERREMLVKELAELPEGTLIKRKRDQKYEFYVYRDENGKMKERYLSLQKDSEIVEALIKKQEKTLRTKKEIIFLDKCLKRLLPVAQQIKDNFSLPMEQFVPQASQKSDKREYLSILTERGEMVRSKSERFIADALYKYNLDYRYEQRLNLKGYVFHPDFTVISPLNGRTYYIEHLGLSDPNYIADWINRKAIYKEHNIVEANNLIVTTEADKNRFSEIIAANFTMERYKNVFL